VKRLVFSSTCATYGLPETMPITEDHHQRPINAYGAGKLMVEQIPADADRAHGLRAVSLRYFNAAGADVSGTIGEWHEPESHLIPLALEVAAGRRQAVDVYGTAYPTADGTCIRDYIHAWTLPGPRPGTASARGGRRQRGLQSRQRQRLSVRQVLETAKRVTGRPVASRPAPRRPGDPPVLVGSSEKARRLLGWTPTFDALETIVQTAWAWHRSRPGGAA
jgi:UDP-glucose 4-epimerase